ncbi:MAG: M48 family metallopeptidase [Methylobacterium mesophilicum]|nr:M48 family metallopeptidase [Methylobacterium mesophilicum]
MQSFLSVFRKAPLALAALAVALTSAPSEAQQRQGGGIPIVRDAEIEALVRDYARPVLQAAGFGKANIEIVLVNDSRFNAFVLGRRVFINTGALMQAETPNEVIGVLAHEAGHLAGHHQERLREQLDRAKNMSVVSTLLGIGAMAAGAAAKNGDVARAGGGIIAGGNELIMRNLLSYQRSEESAADRSAIDYLAATGQSAKGMLVTFQRFQNALSLSGARVDPYRVSHPMPRERIQNLETLARKSPYFDKKDPAELQRRHDMMRAKIAAFTQGAVTASRMFRSQPKGEAATYADALGTYLNGSPATALTKVDGLIKTEPQNAYYRELRGDVLMKANRPQDAAEAYSKAISLDSAKSTTLRMSYAKAMIATGKPAGLEKAVSSLVDAIDEDRENAAAYDLLAQAYAQMGELPESELATAEGHFYRGRIQDAKIFASRAQMKMKPRSPSWLRAQDIINFRQPKKG